MVTLADSLEGAIVVTKRYLDSKLVEPIRRQLREEGRKEGRQEGRQEGRLEGRKEGRQEGMALGEKQERKRWQAWNKRRLAAAANGQPFDKKPPAPDDSGAAGEYSPLRGN